MQKNRSAFIALVWPKDGDFDSPLQGYHVTPGDPGGGTKGGVIQMTWRADVAKGIVTGTLVNATDAQLETVLEVEAWGPICDALPSGIDVMVANGRMMSGAYPRLVQCALGFTGDEVDGDISRETEAALATVEPHTFIKALTGQHYRYLRYELSAATWSEFGDGWTRRLLAADAAALRLAGG